MKSKFIHIICKCWSFCYCHILLIGNNSKCRNCCSWFEYLAVITAELRTSLPFWGDFYHGTGSIYNSIIFYNSFTIKLRVVSLRTKYLGMAVTLQLFDIENIKSMSLYSSFTEILCSYFVWCLLMFLFSSFLKCFNEYYKIIFP